ncbi:MAG: putative integral rane protein [Marmoricola sp.]|nr:putative integral rane protein [Marmoricola sp.]
MTLPGPAPHQPRRRPSTFGGLIYLIVVATTVVGLGLVAFGPWRRGIALVGIGFLFASGMRLVINEGEAGMLRVRGRWFDVVVLAAVGVGLIALATNIPNQAGL